jgi:2-dehydro-3-deoxygalactonokinase
MDLFVSQERIRVVEIVDGNVRRIQTVMTGELFDLIVSKSVLRHSISAEMDEQTFVSSFRSALLDPAGSLSKIFELRSSDVLQITSCKSVEDFISGY